MFFLHGFSFGPLPTNIFRALTNKSSYFQVTGSEFSGNDYGAGFRIRGGACDVDMSDTVMDNNAQSGMNITYSGGRRILQNVKTRRNRGLGMYIDYIHEYKTREERHQKSELIAVTIEVRSFAAQSLIRCSVSILNPTGISIVQFSSYVKSNL